MSVNRRPALRALAVLFLADHLCCEDTRHTQKLLGHYGISARTSAYHDHNAARERPKILKKLADGAAVALVSDAGTPLISDPGYKLVREAAAQGSAVISIPGASALLAGLPEQERTAVALKHCEGWSVAKIAQKMGRTRASVAGLLRRGLKRLRQELCQE